MSSLPFELPSHRPGHEHVLPQSMIVIPKPGTGAEYLAAEFLHRRAGYGSHEFSEYEARSDYSSIRDSDSAVWLPRSGIFLIERPEDEGQLAALSEIARDAQSPIQAVVPVPIYEALNYGVFDPPEGLEQDYGVSASVEVDVTWGVRAVGADRSAYDGRGITVAVLDTGLNFSHPDFQRDAPQMRISLVDGSEGEDGHKHGSHCAGTIGARLPPAHGLRYSVAPGVTLLIVKVLGDNGRAVGGSVVKGYEWALQQGADIVSMSLGSPSVVGVPYDPGFEAAASNALANGVLTIAAAGNDSYRPGYVAPVGRPANCPSVMAVAAVDEAMQVANFSNATIGPYGAVQIAAPGVLVHSASLSPNLYARLSGTSMACPHVAGCAALWAQATGKRGLALAKLLTNNARNIGGISNDVGHGLVQAP